MHQFPVKYSIAIIGKKEEILAFRGLGMETLFVDTVEDAENMLLELRQEETIKHAIIFISEDMFQDISSDVMDKLSGEVLPAIVPIPGLKGSTGFGEMRMRKFVEQAVGSDIFAD